MCSNIRKSMISHIFDKSGGEYEVHISTSTIIVVLKKLFVGVNDVHYKIEGTQTN